MQSNFDIVIVGFGPVGQFAANVLNQYNLKIAVIEKSQDIYLKPRANNLDDEIMRRISRFNDFKKFKNKIIFIKNKHITISSTQLKNQKNIK